MYLQTPLAWAAGKGRPSPLRTWDFSIPTSDGYYRRSGGYLALVKRLLSRKDIQPDCRTKSGETPLTAAAGAGAEDIVKELLRTGKVDAIAKDDYERTPLVAAAGNGHLGVVKLLLSTEGVAADAINQSGICVPLTVAALHGHAAIVRLLLSRPAVDPSQQASYGDRPMFDAVYRGHARVVGVLLANGNVDPSLLSKRGATILGIAAHCGMTDIMRLLLAKGVEPDGKDSEGATPIMYATRRRHVEAVELLLSTGRLQADFGLTKERMMHTS